MIGIIVGLLASCQTEPEPIAFGKDQCHYCKMSIADPKFGAELITDKGRIYKYDATECVVNQLAEESTRYQMLLAVAHNNPKQLYPMDSLVFVISPEFRSPMGANLAAFYRPTTQDLPSNTQLLSWNEVRLLLKNRK
ncbi:hypothetical protein [Tunicatimonas pelagia]|uniref:hypothetical protein n=1 Tax=Tunicatimonas pelagia TaxID=931531 RepID=UPI00266587E7|nr:hypothetical protein [Tunicatimonas pelagia]WKN46418.1 hypothetical protein P0M28_30680 [Tunicatimonas pelagia]